MYNINTFLLLQGTLGQYQTQKQAQGRQCVSLDTQREKAIQPIPPPLHHKIVSEEIKMSQQKFFCCVKHSLHSLRVSRTSWWLGWVRTFPPGLRPQVRGVNCVMDPK